MIDEKTKDMLNRLPLDEVMRNNGYESYSRVGNRYKKYCCPFHGDKDPSFRVDLVPGKGKQYCGTYCYSCQGKSGDATNGAIQLQQALLCKKGQPYDFETAVRRLARDFNIEIHGKNFNNHWHRQSDETIPPSKEFMANIARRPFTDGELRALGCKIEDVVRVARTEEGEEYFTQFDEQGRPMRRYSFNPDFYRRSQQPADFDSTRLSRIFNLYPLCQMQEGEDEEHPAWAYISRQEWEYKTEKGDKVLTSHKFYATSSYPVFVFRYEDEKGWWMRRYEPLFKPQQMANGRYGANYKFTWWYQNNEERKDMRFQLYGDVDVMNALKNFDWKSDIVQTDDSRAPLVDKEYHTKVEDTEVDKKRKVFEKIIICSGPRDGINTYFHSDAHVVWPHSEGTPITDYNMERLLGMAETVYVMYDIDETGLNNMNRLALAHIDLRVVYLPDEIKQITDRRTGKPCKDAEQYFNNYDPTRFFDGQIPNVNEHFACLLNDSKCMRFWDTEYGTKRQKNAPRKEVDKFTINFGNLMCFLQAKGVYNYRDETGKSHYVRIQHNVVDVIDDKEFLTVAKQLMKDFLFANRQHNTLGLSNAISTQKKIDAVSLKEIKTKELNFISWGKDYECFFFSNCVAKVTPQDIVTMDYDQLDCHVNRRAILGGPSFSLEPPLFTITERPEYRKAEERYKEQMSNSHIGAEERVEITRDFNLYKRLWRWQLKFARPIEEMPAPVRFVWDTCRIHWSKEEMGLALTPEEYQRQCMHFVNKAASIGYLLSRYRTGTMQQMTTFTDYRVKNEAQSNGGTGKTTFCHFIESVRKALWIQGMAFKTQPDKMPLNFQEFIDTEHQVVFIDDLRADVQGEEFKNMTSTMVVRTLYQSQYTIPQDRVPKIFCTMNQSLDMNNPSVFRRCFSSYTSDYYHPANYEGTVALRTPAIKFGKDIIKEATDEEYNCIRNMMLQFCQFYLQTQEVVLPPMERDGNNRYLYKIIKESVFIEWANQFFENPRHYDYPLAYDELIISFLQKRDSGVVNKANIRDTKKNFKRYLETYCNNYGILINPDIVFAPKRKPKEWDQMNEQQRFDFNHRPNSDRENGFPRCKAWVTKFMGEEPVEPRVRELQTDARCIFFFRSIKDVPKEVWDLNEVDDYDWELIEQGE